MNKQRKNIAKIYSNEINLENKMKFDENCSYHLFWIRVKNRKKFRQILDEKNIETGTHYRPIHTFDFYQKFKKAPITERIGKEIVTIPMHPNLKTYEIDKIISTINSVN
jgi:dTDP-4-amino-4,6-dideoxygalactose transaminase